MTWIKLDVNFLEHPKIDALSCEAKLLHLWGLCYSGRQLSDGFIPSKQVETAEREPLVAELVTALLWHDVTGGYEIHDYLDHQSSRRQVKAVQESTRKRVEKYRKKGDVTPTVTPTVTPLVTTLDIDIDIEQYMSDFLNLYPRKDGGKAAIKKALQKALKSASIVEILHGASRYRQDPNRDPSYTKMPATWLNKECWNDPLLPPKAVKPFDSRNVPTNSPPRFSEADVPSGGVPMPETISQLFRKGYQQ